MSRHSTLGLCIFIVTFALLSLASPVAAQPNGPIFAVRPARYDPERMETRSYFIYEVAAGQQFHDELRVINTGDQAGSVRLYAVDAATGQNSGAVYLDAEAPRASVGAWLSLEHDTITLAPGEERVIGFTVSVPAAAQPGDHLGAIVAQGAPSTSPQADNNFVINLHVRSVVAVLVDVPGPLQEQLTISAIEPSIYGGQQALLIRFHNDGNRMVKGQGLLQISDSAGQVLHSIPLELNYILPGDQLDFPLSIPNQALPQGNYRARVEFLPHQSATLVIFETALVISQAQIEQLYAAQPQTLPPVAATPQLALAWLPAIFALMAALLFGIYLVGKWRRSSVRL